MIIVDFTWHWYHTVALCVFLTILLVILTGEEW